MIEFDEYKVKLNNIHPKLKELASSLNIEECKVDLDRLHAQIESDGFWDNTDNAQKVTRQASQLEAKIERYEKMCAHWDDIGQSCPPSENRGACKIKYHYEKRVFKRKFAIPSRIC